MRLRPLQKDKIQYRFFGSVLLPKLEAFYYIHNRVRIIKYHLNKKKCDTIKLTIIYCFSSVKNIDTYTFKNETALSNSKKIESYVDVILNY